MSNDLRFGEVLPLLYDALSQEKNPPVKKMPKSDIAYITSLLNNKFNKNYSFAEVEKLLAEEKIPRTVVNRQDDKLVA